MKKLVSLLIALMLAVSLFCVTAIAFADESAEDTSDTSDTEERTISVDNDALEALISNAKIQAVNSKFQPDNSWLNDAENVAGVFGNIVYAFEDSQSVAFTDSDSKVKTITLKDGELTVEFAPDSETLSVVLSNSSYNADAENPLVGTWTNGNNSITFEDDSNASGALYYTDSEGNDATLAVSLTSVELNKYDLTDESDTVKLQYLSVDDDIKDDDEWNSVAVDSTVNVSSEGWWAFRYVVYLNGNSSDIAAKTDAFNIYFYDGDAPVVSGLSTSMKNTQTNGVKVGSTYTISTSLSATDTSSKTVTYEVYKLVNETTWTIIYDSTKDSSERVTEGYEDCISSSGVITMLESDLLADSQPIYKIVYTVTDEMGYVTTTDSDGNAIEMTIFAVAKDAEETDYTEIIKIVLYCVAGVCLIGLIVVLCIKPKDEENTSAKQ